MRNPNDKIPESDIVYLRKKGTLETFACPKEEQLVLNANTPNSDIVIITKKEHEECLAKKAKR